MVISMKYIYIMIGIMIIISACTNQAQKVDSFEECVKQTGKVMESYPRQCSYDGETFVEKIDKDIRPCTKEYMPVCAEVKVECVTAPCDPIKTTFANRCEAENAGATNIIEGQCQDETKNLKGACLSFDGNWVEGSKECEGMGKAQCNELGGEFDPCASACRNDPDAQICTMQCVQVCKFD